MSNKSFQTASGKAVRVVVAEDDYLVCEEIKRALRTLAYEVVGEADNGEQVVALGCSLRPDVMLMDIKMPKLDGLQASRQIMAECPLPIVILTAHESHDLLQEARTAGVGAYLTKPPRPAEIHRAVTIAMARFDDMMELARLNKELQQSLEEIRLLRDILPICSYCKKIRNDEGYYQQLESYLHQRAGIDFSHTICPQCIEKNFPEYAQELQEKNKD